MDKRDVHHKILSNINTDIKNLSTSCSTDSLSRKVCSEASHWQPIFADYGLPFPKIHYTTPADWIIEFETQRKLKFYTDRLMDILEHPKLEDFKNVEEFFVADPISLLVYQNDVSFPAVFNVKGVDLIEVTTTFNKAILNLLDDKLDRYGSTAAYLKIHDGEYIIQIIYYSSLGRNIFEYSIDRDSMKKVMYNILSNGSVPRDSYFEHKVKLM